MTFVSFLEQSVSLTHALFLAAVRRDGRRGWSEGTRKKKTLSGTSQRMTRENPQGFTEEFMLFWLSWVELLFDVLDEVLALEELCTLDGPRGPLENLECSLQKLLLFSYLYSAGTIRATTSTGFTLNWKLPFYGGPAFGARVDAVLPRLGLEELLNFLFGSPFAIGGAEYLSSVAGFLESSFADGARRADKMRLVHGDTLTTTEGRRIFPLSYGISLRHRGAQTLRPIDDREPRQLQCGGRCMVTWMSRTAVALT